MGKYNRFSLSVENEQADAGRDGQTHIARPNSQARPGIPLEGVGKRGVSWLVHGDLLPRQHSFGTTLRFTGPVPADPRQ